MGAICPTCSCSLVRLGVDVSSAPVERHEGAEYRFCCQGCAEAFYADPAGYLAEIADWVVCPVCFGEKPRAMTVATEHSGAEVRLCRCPGCLTAFACSSPPSRPWKAAHERPLQGAGADADIKLRRVETPQAAAAERFLGSPTMRIDGRDVEPGAGDRTDFGLKCRLSRGPAGASPVPPEKWIIDALGEDRVGAP